MGVSKLSGHFYSVNQWFQPRSWRPPNTACFPCHLNQTHLIQIIISLVETPRSELGVSVKGEMQNVQCGGPPGTWLGTTAVSELIL